MKQGLVRLLYNLGKVHGVDITHDNVCSSMLSCFYSHLLSTGRPISSCLLSMSPKKFQICSLIAKVSFSNCKIPTETQFMDIMPL